MPSMISTRMSDKAYKVFVDTSSFVSLEDNKDPNHKKAIVLAQALFNQKAKLYTSSDIIGETLTVISRKLGKKASFMFYENYIKSGFTEIFIDSNLHEETREFFLKVRSKNISFIDCSSILAMKQQGITQIFSFDKDFITLGVELFRGK